MLLDDLLDDREAKPGAAHPRRHVRLGQPLAVFGKPHAGIEDVDHKVAVLVVELKFDAVAGEAMLAAIHPSFNGFDAVLYNVGQRLRELAAVADHAALPVPRAEDLDVA